MILRSEQGRLRLVLQTDHAGVCGEFAAAWGGERFQAPVPCGPVKLAAASHDDGWSDWEEAPRIVPDTGRPYDFLGLPADQHVALYDRGIASTVAQHPYAGLLVSLHGTGLYKRRYGHMSHLRFGDVPAEHRETVDRYLANQEALQEQLSAELQPDPLALWMHYRWLQAWDLLSLFLCLTDPAERQKVQLGVLPLSPGGPEVALTAQGVGLGTIGVDPWPFAVDLLDVLLPVRHLNDRVYGSDAEFQAAFDAAPTESVPLRLVASE